MTVREWDGERATPAAQSGNPSGQESCVKGMLRWLSVKFCAIFLCHFFEILIVKTSPVLQVFRLKPDISVA